MLIQAQAKLAIAPASLSETLRTLAEFIERQLVPGPDAELAVALMQTGSRGNALLASRLAPETQEFSLGLAPTGQGLTAREFREAIAQKKPKHTSSEVRVRGLAHADSVRLIRELANALPPSGRGVMLVGHFSDWRLADGDTRVAVDVHFGRPHRPPVCTAVIGVRFEAPGGKDPIVADTLTELSRRLDVQFDARVSVRPPKPEATGRTAQDVASHAAGAAAAATGLVVVQSVYETLARATDIIGARAEDLERVPFLFGGSGAFNKRLTDVQAGKKEVVNLGSALKQFMKGRFPAYRPDTSGTEQTSFRRSLGPTLDLIVGFDRVHQWGLGKSFRTDLRVDFPGTPFFGVLGLTGVSLFWLFHYGPQTHAWAYTTRGELAEALDGCGALLGRMLPAIEEQCRSLLVPPPTVLLPGTPRYGPLSARDALAIAWPMAQAWAPDVELQRITSGYPAPVRSRRLVLTPNGRLADGGGWTIVVLSKARDMLCHYAVPHAGRIWWTLYPVVQQTSPKYSASVAVDDWSDSPRIAPLALAAAQEQIGAPHDLDLMLTLDDPSRYQGHFVWTAWCTARDGAVSGIRPIAVRLDRHTGHPLEITAV